jgi:endo-1,4-beta-xylanase
MKDNYTPFVLLLFAIFQSQISFAQPTGEKIKQQASSDTSAAVSLLQQQERNKIEKVYMQQAKHDIEKYRKGDASLVITDEAGEPLKNVQVQINQVSQDFLFGNLCEEVFRPGIKPEDATKFKEKFKALFNFTELTVKWAPYEPEQGKPEWQKLQEKLDWCKANDITPKGHTLGWTHEAGTPRWLLKLPSGQATELYKARIHNLVGGFKSQVRMWDVVNEPVTTIPWEKALLDTNIGAGQIDAGTRYNVTNITLKETVPWIENSYKWANEADPNGDFILNEFYVIGKPEIREKLYRLIKELQKRNVPVKGVGIQAHEPRDMWFSPVEVVKTFDKFKELGLPLHITEFTPQSSGKAITGGWRNGTWTDEAQAEFAEQFYTLAFAHPSMVSIHWWGLSDRFIWLPGGGLLDKDFNPKPVYNRLMKLIKGDWMTKNLNVATNKIGEATFRGFYGKYEIVVKKADGSVKTFNVHLKEKQSNNWIFKF